MNVYITLDYELFFGKQSGTALNCIIKPTEALLELVDPYDIKFTCFVDSGYLLALQRERVKHPQLAKDLEIVSAQIRKLSDQGHGIELHVHPHWEDSYYDGTQWIFDTSRYKLADFEEADVEKIMEDYALILKKISGKSPQAYRAGGWSAQPFSHIKRALEKQNVFMDSTVFPGGNYASENQVFNFTNVAQYKTHYKFSDDLTVEDHSGQFEEIPISSYMVSPQFFWKLAFTKLIKSTKHKPYGDGQAISQSGSGLLKLLTSSSRSVVSIDGFKASFLDRAFRKYQENTDKNANFVIIGHPKAFTPYSLKKTKEFLAKTHSEHTYKTFQ